MIVKIWPIKADYANDDNKIGGVEGLKNAVDYITDAEKVIAGRDDSRQMNVLQEDFVEMGPEDFRSDNKIRTLQYMSNEDKIKGKYISGYLCNPQRAVSDFNVARMDTLSTTNKNVTKETGAVAYHIVQSFPDGLSISDEEVHQCGLELCERLNAYQAVICSHVHPVTDEDGIVHGKNKHNHILINAYIHPDKLDPKNPDIAKYNDCKESYAQLRVWNDEIAIAHGLPIIRNPDDDRIYSWKEKDAINEGLSWKQRVRVDIEEAKRAAGNWDEFLQIMVGFGYKIRDGVQTSYRTPDGKTVRGNTLGRLYSKESLQRYWTFHDYVLQNVKTENSEPASPALLDFIVASQDKLTVAVPVGMKAINVQSYYYLPLENISHQSEALWTYFNEDERYDICDDQNRSVMTATGREIIDCMEKLRSGKRAYFENRNNYKEEREESNSNSGYQRKKSQYYTNPHYVNNRTRRPYRTSLYDKNGRRRTMLELILMLAITVLKNESGRWDALDMPAGKTNQPVYAPTDWKIQNMIDTIYIAQDEKIDTLAQLDVRLKDAGAALSRAKSAYKKTVRAKEKMETLNEAITMYRKTETLAQKILDMPDGPEKDQLSVEYKDVLASYKSAKAVLYQYQVTTEDGVKDFEQRYKKIKSDIAELEERLDSAKEEYRRLKKLSYNLELAQNAQYCYGPEYSYDKTYQQEYVQDDDETRNQRAQQKIDELIRESNNLNRQDRNEMEAGDDRSKQ